MITAQLTIMAVDNLLFYSIWIVYSVMFVLLRIPLLALLAVAVPLSLSAVCTVLSLCHLQNQYNSSHTPVKGLVNRQQTFFIPIIALQKYPTGSGTFVISFYRIVLFLSLSSKRF